MQSHLFCEKIPARREMRVQVSHWASEILDLPGFVAAIKFPIVRGNGRPRRLHFRNLFNHQQVTTTHVPIARNLRTLRVPRKEPADESGIYVEKRTGAVGVATLAIRTHRKAGVSPSIEFLIGCVFQDGGRDLSNMCGVCVISPDGFVSQFPPDSRMQERKITSPVVDMVPFELKDEATPKPN